MDNETSIWLLYSVMLLASCSFDPSVEPPDSPMADAMASPLDWWNSDYPYRTQLRVDTSSLNEPLLDVPILLVLDTARVPYLEDTPPGGLRIVDGDFNALDHEIETWDPEGTTFIWTRVPVLTPASSTSLALYHGGPEDSPQPAPAGVWHKDYLAVWHMRENVLAGQTDAIHNDSTANAHHGIQNRNGPLTGLGAIGRAQVFNGLDEFVEVPVDGDMRASHPNMTIVARAWVTYNVDADFQHIIGAGGAKDSGRYRQLYWDTDTDGWTSRYRAAGQDPQVLSEAGAYDQWSVVASVYDGSEIRVYLDGQEVGDALSLSGALDPIATFAIGGNPYLDATDGQNRTFNGYIDEVRISTVARSDTWLQWQYRSMSDTLVSYEATECMDACPP